MALVDIFQYSNIYTTGPRVNLLASNPDFGRQCVAYITKQKMLKPLVSKVFSLYCSMDPSTRLADFCLTHDTNSLHIDDRSLLHLVSYMALFVECTNIPRIYQAVMRLEALITIAQSTAMSITAQSDKPKIDALKNLADGT